MPFGSLEIAVFSILTLLTWVILRGLGRSSKAAPKQQLTIRRLPDLDPVDDPDASAVGRFDRWFHRAVMLAQRYWSTAEATWLIIGLAAVAATAAFVFTERADTAMFVAIATLFLGVIGFSIAYRHIVSKFQSQLPQAMQLMARAVRAGESLEQAVHLVAESADDPLRTEFRRCLKQVEMGLPVRTAMAALADRMDTLDTRIFGSTVSVHRETGGGLAVTLDRLAEVIRNRFDYHRKLKSTTGAGRVSVIIIALLGLIIFSYMFLFRPDYGKEMWTDPTGRTMLTCAVLFETVGLIWVWMLLKAEY